MDNIKEEFGQRVKELRLSKGYSQEKLAEISDLDRT
jgi:transcriptional regulator with XRE-family HTH domain